MVWPLIAMAAMSMMQQNQQAKGAADAAAGRAEDSIAQSKAIMEANRKNFQQSAFRIGMLNVQKAQEVRALQQRKFDVGAKEQAVLGSTAVNAAASGTVGASVDAVQTDIQMAFDRVRGQISDENEMNALNYNTALYDLVTNGQNAQQTAYYKKEKMGPNQFQMLGNAAIQVAGSYMSQKMDLGLGAQAQPQSFGTSAGFTLSR